MCSYFSHQIGIVSSGTNNNKCGLLNSPGLYTRVKFYLSWIKKHVKDGHCGKLKKKIKKKPSMPKKKRKKKTVKRNNNVRKRFQKSRKKIIRRKRKRPIKIRRFKRQPRPKKNPRKRVKKRTRVKRATKTKSMQRKRKHSF